MGVGAGVYMYDVVVKSSCSLSHLLMSSCLTFVFLLPVTGWPPSTRNVAYKVVEPNKFRKPFSLARLQQNTELFYFSEKLVEAITFVGTTW